MPPHDITGNLNADEVVIAPGALPSTPASAAKTITYPFVNLVRFVATIGIVYIHTEVFLTGSQATFFHKVNHIEYYFIIRQIFKFSTICYFLIAGFLLAGKMQGGSLFKYYLRRLNVIARPYLLALLVFIAVIIARHIAETTQPLTFQYLADSCKFVLFYTPFWYVPNYLLCLLVLVCFSRYITSLYFGGLLFLITLIYTYTNVYGADHNGTHTTALLGYVFYMWLGVYINKANFISKINKLHPLLPGAIVLLMLILCNCESWYLFNYIHTRDVLNTLRITNQLYSVAMFVFLVRLCGKSPNFGIFKPKEETYGIYLYHSFFIFFIIPETENWLCRQFHVTLFSYNVYQMIAINFVNFIICYLATTALVKVMLRFRFGWLSVQ